MLLIPKTKKEFTKRYLIGEFGNQPRTWSSQQQVIDSGFTGKVTIRAKTPGSPAYYNVPVDKLHAYPETNSYNESMPDENLIFQGEVQRLWNGLNLTYSLIPNLKYRDALQKPLYTVGLSANLLLKQYLNQNSYEDLLELLNIYYDLNIHESAVIEFSTYSYNIGRLPHRNTVFWEVRGY